MVLVGQLIRRLWLRSRLMFCLVLVFNSQITMETSNNLTFLQRVRSGRCNTPCSGQQRHQVPRPTWVPRAGWRGCSGGTFTFVQRGMLCYFCRYTSGSPVGPHQKERLATALLQGTFWVTCGVGQLRRDFWRQLSLLLVVTLVCLGWPLSDSGAEAEPELADCLCGRFTHFGVGPTQVSLVVDDDSDLWDCRHTLWVPQVQGRLGDPLCGVWVGLLPQDYWHFLEAGRVHDRIGAQEIHPAHEGLQRVLGKIGIRCTDSGLDQAALGTILQLECSTGSWVCGHSSKDGALGLAIFTVATGSLDPTDQQCGASAHLGGRVQDRCKVWAGEDSPGWPPFGWQAMVCDWVDAGPGALSLRQQFGVELGLRISGVVSNAGSLGDLWLPAGCWNTAGGIRPMRPWPRPERGRLPRGHSCSSTCNSPITFSGRACNSPSVGGLEVKIKTQMIWRTENFLTSNVAVGSSKTLRRLT